MAAKTFVVSGPLATPYRTDGTRAYLYKDTEFVSDGLREGEVERMLDLGLVDEVSGNAASKSSK